MADTDSKNKFFGVNDSLWGHKWGFKDLQFVINDDESVSFLPVTDIKVYLEKICCTLFYLLKVSWISR